MQAVRCIGGPVQIGGGGDGVRMRVFVDHSVVEVFLGSGEALSTR